MFDFLGRDRPIEPRQSAPHQLHAPEGKFMYRILTEEKSVDLVKAALIDLGLDFTPFSGHGK